ncbi:MAG TPA: transposase [Anaerolineae bacterium]|nr:transposase [Anaerolineae bacterium]
MLWDKPYRPVRNQRLSPELYIWSNRVYFITVRADRNQRPFVTDELNTLVLDVLREEEVRQNCMVFTYCLMPDHLHFLVSPGEDGISVLQFTDQFKGKSTNGGWSVGWQGKLWQRRYYDHVVRHAENLRAIAEYILGNPVRKNLVVEAEDWLWSGHMNPLPV